MSLFSDFFPCCNGSLTLHHTSVMALVLGRHRQLLRDLLLVLKGTLMLCCGQ